MLRSGTTTPYRDPARKERILLAAASLFSTSGYHNIGMADIGSAAGIVGSGIYKHFANKGAILAALMDRILYLLQSSANRAAAESDEPHEIVLSLIDAHINIAISQSPVFRVYLQELRNLPDPDARAVRRQQHDYLELWVRLLGDLHPGQSETEVRLRARAGIGVIHSVLYPSSNLRPADLTDLLKPMVRSVLQI
jgi:AcrR family transcriptional regulator